MLIQTFPIGRFQTKQQLADFGNGSQLGFADLTTWREAIKKVSWLSEEDKQAILNWSIGQ